MQKKIPVKLLAGINFFAQKFSVKLADKKNPREIARGDKFFYVQSNAPTA